jgi:hypothetical protein
MLYAYAPAEKSSQVIGRSSCLAGDSPGRMGVGRGEDVFVECLLAVARKMPYGRRELPYLSIFQGVTGG